MRSLAAGTLGLALLGVAPGPARGQQGCEWLPPTEDVRTQEFGATRLITATRPHLRCRDGITLRADSARHFENQGFFQLFGNAFFENPEQRLEGDLIRYWRNDGRVEARGDARLSSIEDGSVVTGEELDLLQAGERRDEDRLTVTGGRPRILFHPSSPGPPGAVPAPGRDSAQAPWDVTADRLFVQGRSYLVASGDVEARRDSVEAYAEALEFDDRIDRLVLRTDARMLTGGYEMRGDSIFGHVVDDEIRSLTAFHDAVLDGEDLRVSAPRITVERPSGTVERLVATLLPAISQPAPGLEEPDAPALPDSVSVFDLEHPPRPVARAEDFRMVADSIDVHAPGEILERLVAVGRARGESTARDSLNTPTTPEIARRDWIDGDTIVATFSLVDSAAERRPPPDPEGVETRGDPRPVAGERPDSAGRRYRLEELISRVNARSLYRLAPADSAEARTVDGTSTRLAVHYVTGRQIRIAFEEGEVELMEVVGATQGIHLEPVGGEAPRPDSVADTTVVDTTSVLDAPSAAPPEASVPATGRSPTRGGLRPRDERLLGSRHPRPWRRRP